MTFSSRSGQSVGYTHPNGFTLIELLITVVIVGIITAIALPSYRSYTLKSHRSDAIQALALYQTMIERCYAQNLVYNGACFAALTIGPNSPNGFYAVAATTGTATYMITATAQGSQASDTTCSAFTVDQTNTRNGPTGSANGIPLSCWNP